MLGKKRKGVIGNITWQRRKVPKEDRPNSSFGTPTIYHALVIIFLEFFSWGLLTTPMISVLNKTFPEHTFLMNGLIQGVKGLLSFLSAPLIGALSDVLGRKPFLLLTVTFTCAPIPLMRFSPWWYFAMITISGVFAVTFSVVFAYVADITPEEDRSSAYGLVSATFAASLITSPAIGTYLSHLYSDNLVIALASSIALLDVLFILVALPESLPEKIRPASWGTHISWETADPFGALKKIGKDQLILMLCFTVFLSYLPEAGEYSCFFVYLKLVVNFNEEEIALFIGIVGVLSVLAQTVVLGQLMKYLGNKVSIVIGLVFEMLQLLWYGLGSQPWMMWAAGSLASMSSITYPAISAFVSSHAAPDQQGVAQGIITGIRGLCNGLGPALFGFIFYLFGYQLNETTTTGVKSTTDVNVTNHSHHHRVLESVLPGPPFAFGAFLVMCALFVAYFIPSNPHSMVTLKTFARRSSQDRHHSGDRHRLHELEQPLINSHDKA